MNEVDIVVSDKYVARGGFGVARKNLQQLENDAKKTGKTFADVGGGIEKVGTKAASGFADAFLGAVDGLGSKLPAALGNPAVAGAMAASAALVGGAAGGALVTAFGGALAGLGLATAAQSGEVKMRFADLTADLGRELRSISEPFQETLLDIADRAEESFGKFKPTLQRVFADLAPEVSRFADSIFDGFDEFEPALQPLADAFQAIMSDIGGRFPGIVEGLADAFIDLAESIEKSPEALGTLLELIGNIAEAGISDLSALNDLFADFNEEAEMFANWFQGGDYELDVKYKVDQDSVHQMQEAFMSAAGLGAEATRSTYDAASASEQLSAVFAELAGTAGDVASRGQAIVQVLDILTGRTPSYEESTQTINDAIRDLGDMFSRAGSQADGYGAALLNADGSVNTMTENGSRLQDTMVTLQSGFANSAAAVRELENAGWAHDAAVQKVNGDMSVQIDRLMATASQMGLTEGQMRQLLAAYGLTPDYLDTIARLDENGVPEKINEIARPRTVVFTGFLDMSQIPSGRSPYARESGGVTAGSRDGFAYAATGGARGNNVIMNEGGPEAVRLPQGSTVIPAGMTRALEERWADGGGGMPTIVFEAFGSSNKWLLDAIRENVRVKFGGNVQKALGG